MKSIAFFPLFFVLTFSADNCNKENNPVYRGRLEVKGLCMNYTIKLIEGNLDKSKIVAEWKNEVTGMTHTNVFALGSLCTFPENIKEGDEFYFKIDTSPVQNCAVCLAYYPKPGKSLAIKIINKN
jgi:hypothetical protein